MLGCLLTHSDISLGPGPHPDLINSYHEILSPTGVHLTDQLMLRFIVYAIK
jgi:hypothetical protein